jgi:hypothetical protein
MAKRVRPGPTGPPPNEVPVAAEPSGPPQIVALPKRTTSRTALIVDGLERGERARVRICFVFEVLLFAVGCFLLVLAAFAPNAHLDARTVSGIAGACFTAAGVTVRGLHTIAVQSAERWAGFSKAYRDPDLTPEELIEYDKYVFDHLRRETQHVGLSGIFKSRGTAAT